MCTIFLLVVLDNRNNIRNLPLIMSEGLFSEFATAFVGTMIHMKEDVIGPSQLIPN